MKVQIRRYVIAAAAAGVFTAIGAVALPTGSAGWEPVTYGLTTSPDQLLPATVSADKPARVVTTTVGADGRPVVTVKEATDKQAATRLVEDGQRTDDAVSVEVDAPMYAYDAPTGTDPSRTQQWSLTTLKADEAWKKSTGAGVTVAVIDSGVDSRHPDLAANVLSGYDATTDTAGPTTDAHGHGTHVAGTIAAVTGNAVGIAGMAPNVKILPVKVLGANGSGNMSDAAEGIIWATDHGAKILNMSLGSTQKVTAVTNAINYARSKGVTVIAAMGNSRTSGSPTSYPAADTGVIGVAATDSNDRVATYSTAGNYADVAAPGTNILSTYPTSRGGYKTMSGTSMASPHVAAVAALLKSANPALTPDQIETTLEKTATDLGTPGFDNDFGNGRINPVAALAAIAPAAPTTPVTKTPTTPATKAPTTAPATKAPTTAPTTPPATKAPTTAPTTKAPTTAPTTKTPTTAPTTSAPTGAAAYEAQVITLTNAQRTANGCAAARTDDRLTTAARAHSTDMVTNNFFSHTGSDGSNFVTRASRAGYTAPSGENIAYGYRTPQDVVTGWMNSPGHRANILNCQSIAIGVGLATKADGTPYWTQVFGRA
ncbi:S8 family serine peptidase [Actinoplanes sp. NPDC026670]|uniref:S8 family serine peptidase n=1 Tax=Actinoplanes sp. NPDC026670 TaxID=3154700 RepID=UPI0033DC4BAA